MTGCRNDNLDLMLGDPAGFVTAEVELGARALLSAAHMWQGASYDQIGALVFVRSDSDISRFEDISGRRIMGVTARELTGWKLAHQEFRKYRIDVNRSASDVLFSGGNQREVVYAVQNGLVDVGVIRAGVLEMLADQGVIDLDDFRPVMPIPHAGYPFWVSTPLFPSWVIAALPHVEDDALALVIDTLLKVDTTTPASQAANGVAWQAPQNYVAVHELLISLRARPYENYMRQAATRIFRAYKWPVLGLGALILLSTAFLIYEVRRHARLAEAQKDVLQSETRSKQFYRNAIEDHTVFCMLTKDGKISHVNEHFVTALDRSRGSLMHRPLSEILNSTNQDTLEEQIMTAMEAGVPWQGALQLRKQDGNAAWVQSTFIPVTGASKKLSEIAIVASDVTKTREGVSETRFNNTLELIQDQVIVMRPGDLQINYANLAAEETLVKQRMGGEWRGKKVSDFITDEDLEVLQMRCEAVQEGPQRRVTWETEGRNGVTYEISLEYAQPENEAPCLIAIYRDVSERKAIEKAKNEFIATVSHELRTPLTSIKGALGLAMSGAVGEMPDKMSGVVDMAATSCDRLVVLINDILDLEKIEAGKMDFQMQPINLDDLVGDAIQTNAFYGEKFDVTFERLPQDDYADYTTLGDPARLTQVMDNLMSNAAKFSQPGSKVNVGLERMADRIRLTIRDFGAGIPEKAKATIFDKFTQADSSDTRSKGGTGLGLSIVKLIVEHHHGRVTFVSREDVGTEFFVDLPQLAGDRIVKIAALKEDDDVPSDFSDAIQEVNIELMSVPENAVQRLLELLRQDGLEVEFEHGRVRTQQLANGKGVLGTSSALQWLGAAQRGFLSDMISQGNLGERDVAVIEINEDADPTNTLAKRSHAAALSIQAWLANCTDLLPEGAAPQIVAISGAAELSAWLTEQKIVTVPQAAQAFALSEWADTDLVLQFGNIQEAATIAIYPKEDAALPDDWPFVLLVSRVDVAESGLGKVAKFSSGGGGRARRRA